MKKVCGVLALILLSVMVISLFASCAGGDGRLIGTWHQVNEDGNETGTEMVLSKSGDGSYGESGVSGSVKWSVNGDKLTLTVSICGTSSSEEYTYSISGNKMTLVSSDSTEYWVKQ